MYEMRKKNVSIQQMIEVLSMSRSAFYRKCNGITEFTQGEIQRIVDHLDLDSPMEIFFEKKLPNSRLTGKTPQGGTMQLEYTIDPVAAEQNALAAECRILIEKLSGQAEYRRSIEARSVPDAYNGLAVLLRDMAEMMEQPLDHVVAVLATVTLAPYINR